MFHAPKEVEKEIYRHLPEFIEVNGIQYEREFLHKREEPVLFMQYVQTGKSLLHLGDDVVLCPRCYLITPDEPYGKIKEYGEICMPKIYDMIAHYLHEVKSIPGIKIKYSIKQKYTAVINAIHIKRTALIFTFIAAISLIGASVLNDPAVFYTPVIMTIILFGLAVLSIVRNTLKSL